MIAASLRCSRANGIPFGLSRGAPQDPTGDHKSGRPASQIRIRSRVCLAAQSNSTRSPLCYPGWRPRGGMNENRKIAAILAADVVGYSRLAGADEDRTLSRLRALRSDLIDPTIAVHKGRVVKRTGDGLISEFRSVVDAVRCAIEVQNGLIERNVGVPPERRIEFRVG